MNQQFNNFDPSMLWIFIIVFFGICAAFLVIGNCVNMIKGWRKPKVEDSKTVEDKLANDNERIKELEDKQKETSEELALLLQSTLALIKHSITNNNIENLKREQAKIEDYLIQRR